ncbi:MAG: hypothetical protein ACOC8E_08765 [Planctomycetota bacterium]
MSYVVAPRSGGGKDPADGIRTDSPADVVGYYDEWDWRAYPCSYNCGWSGVVDLSDMTALRYVAFYANDIAELVLDAGAPGRVKWFEIDYNPNYEGDLDFSGWTALEMLMCGNTKAGARVDVTGCTALAMCACSCWNGSQIVGIDGLDTTPVTDCYAEGNGMSSDEVDHILVDLDANGQSDGYVYLMDNSPPGPAGLAAKTSLEGKGWSVDVDS